MTETSTAPTRALALAPTAPGQIQTAGEMVEALKAVQAAIAPDLNPSELKLFAMVAYRSGLDPFARQIHAVKRQGKVTFQTGIDGFRSSAERTGTYDGQDEPEFGPACSCKEAPQPHPEWARVTVYRIRNGGRKPQSATAYWHEFKPAPGQSGNGDQMWKKMPRNQLAKCAEALAFRKAFPYVLADVYAPEEMDQAGPVVLEHRPTAREAVAQRRAEAEAADQSGTGEVSADEAATDATDDVVEGQVSEVDESAWDAQPSAAMELSAEAFTALREQHGILIPVVRQAAKELFPDAKGLGDLSDLDRAVLWSAIAPGNEAA
jgi:phage recombination protein Bet